MLGANSARCALVGMGDSTTEARGRSWRLVLAPWFEEQRAALRSFGNDESSALLFALRTDGGKLEVFVTCKENRRVSWLSKNVTKGEWTSAAAPKTKEERLNFLAQYHEVCDRSTNWQPKSVQSTPVALAVASSAQAPGGAHLPPLLPPPALALRPPLLPPPPPHHLQSPSPPPPPETPARPSMPAPPSPEDQIGLASELWELLHRDQAEEGEVRGLTEVRGRFAIRSEDGRSQTPFAMGVLSMKNLRERLVCIAWEEDIEGSHGNASWVRLERVVQPSAESTTVCPSCACEFDRAARHCPECFQRASKRKLGPEPGSTAAQNSPERLSCQMYGNLNVDVNALKELSEPRADGLQLTEAEQFEAAGLIKDVYLPQSLSQEGGSAVFATNSNDPTAQKEQQRQGDIAWKAALAQQSVAVSGPRSAESPATFSASAVTAAMKVIANARKGHRAAEEVQVWEAALTGTPAYEGLLPNLYPSAAIEHCLTHNLDVSTESVATHVGVAAAASLGLDRCKVLPKETSLLVQAADLAGAEPILVEPLPDALEASARAIATFIKKNNLTEQLGTVFQHGPARHTERSIMFGVCSGQKSQQPFSASTGNYGVPAKTDKKVALKMELQKLLNAHGLLAAAEIQRTQPELYKKMARLRVLLGRHPVFSAAAAAAEGNLPFDNPIFTNGYVSVGARATARHTDYRNPSATHLTTMQLGDWVGALLTGQTVLFNRFGTECIVIEDRPGGRQIMGGLNAISHGNMIPVHE